jgi:hypothetical protein
VPLVWYLLARCNEVFLAFYLRCVRQAAYEGLEAQLTTRFLGVADSPASTYEDALQMQRPPPPDADDVSLDEVGKVLSIGARGRRGPDHRHGARAMAGLLRPAGSSLVARRAEPSCAP